MVASENCEKGCGAGTDTAHCSIIGVDIYSFDISRHRRLHSCYHGENPCESARNCPHGTREHAAAIQRRP